MIKRPIVWFGLAYVFGEILGNIIGWAALPVFAVLFAACIWICVHSGRIQKKGARRRWALRTRLVFCVLPVFMSAGSIRLLEDRQTAETVWAAGDFETPVTLKCIVEKTEVKAKSKSVYVKVIKGDVNLPLTDKLLIVADLSETAAYGDTIVVSGCPKRFEKASNPGTYDAWAANSVSGLYYQMFPEHMDVISHGGLPAAKALLRLKARLTAVYHSVLDEETAGVLCGIMLGDKQGLSKELKTLYQSQGIGHLFAVSGLHMSMAGVGIYRLLRKVTMPPGAAFAAAFLLMAAYGFMCGMPVSCIRALLMAALLMGAELLGRSYDGVSALALAGLIILWRQPLGLTSFGILMSFGAVFSLIGFLPVLIKNKPGHLSEKLLPGLSITLITMPVLAWYLYEIPLYSTVLNFFLLPLMGILFPMAALGGIIGLFCIPAAKFLTGIVYFILQLYTYVCHFFERLPFSVIVTGRPSPELMVLLIVVFPLAFIAVSRHYKKKVLLLGIGFLAAGYGLLALPKIPKQPRIIFMDVGQGDCALLSMSDGTNWLIDGGSSSQKDVHTYVIEKVLKFYGIGRLDGVFLSHMDGDHTNGVKGLMASGDEIGTLYFPACCPSKEKQEAMCRLASEKNIRTNVFKAGEAISGNVPGKNGRWYIKCIHPLPDFVTEDDNEASMMLLLNIEGVTVLFTGDGEAMAEAAAIGALPDIDLLKAGHHGSKSSSGSDFLAQIKPEAAVVSCGKNNRYGHPHEETMQRFENIDCGTFVTAQNGAVLVTAAHGRFDIQTYLTEENKKQFQ